MLNDGRTRGRAALGCISFALLAGAAACSASDSKSTGQLPNGSGATAGTGGTSTTGGGAGTGGSGPAGAGGSSSGAGGGVGAGGSGGASGTTGGGGVGGTTGKGGAGGAGNVTFDWPETQPGTGTCKAGHYVGDFNGFFAPSALFFPLPIPVTGTVDLTLQESTNGEFFDISNGKVTGLANGLYPYSADVLGRLNCVTRKLENGFLKNGKYTITPTDFPFEGPITSDYDTLTYAFINATWDVKEPNPAFGGNGTWNARFTP